MNKHERIEERYRKNIELLPEYEDYIFRQTSDRLAELRFGDKGSVGPNGCGAIAVYNAMKRVGRKQNLCDVLRDFERLDMSWMRGLFGTKPWSLGRYFRKKDIPYREYSSPVGFKAALQNASAGIVCTWNRRFYGMHFYFICYDEEKRYLTANFRSSGDWFRPAPPDEISNHLFVVGYIINPETYSMLTQK